MADTPMFNTSLNVTPPPIVPTPADATSVASAARITTDNATTAAAAAKAAAAATSSTTIDPSSVAQPTKRNTTVIRYRDHAGNDSTRNEVVMTAGVRAFIMGVEVSDFLVGDISVTRATRGNDGTCSFSLDNNYDRFIIRPENLGGVTPAYDPNQGTHYAQMLPSLGTQLYSNDIRQLDHSKFSWIIADTNKYQGTFEYDETPKKAIFEYKYPQILEFHGINNANSASVAQFSVGGAAVSPSNQQQVNTNPSLGSKTQPRYNLTVGACVIHLHDEVRLFVADPNQDPMSSEERRWMPLFTGVVNTVPVSRNRVTGESTINLTCADVRYLIRKMRLAANIQSADQKKIYVKFDDEVGMFQDVMPLANASDGKVKFENVLSTLSYREITRALLCGDSKVDIAALDNQNSRGADVARLDLIQGRNPYLDKLDTANNHQYSDDLNMRGVGTFSIGKEQAYDPSAQDTEKVAILENWNDLILFGIKQDWYTDAEVDIIGNGTRPIDFNTSLSSNNSYGNADVDAATQTPSPFSVMNGFVHYLLPGKSANGLGIRNALERALVSPGSDVNWSNRMDVLNQTSETLDYQFYVSPMGDFIFEFPMYDFMPYIFGKYSQCYTVGDSIKSDEHNDEGDGNVATGLIVRGGFQDINVGSNTQTNETVQDQAYSIIIKSDFMAAKYGIVIEEYSIPWLDKAWSYGTTTVNGQTYDTNTLKRNALISFGIIEFYRRIAAMSSMSFSGCYNPFWLPNRPILNILQRRIGLSNSCSISIPIEGAPTSSVETSFIRLADNNNKFVNICGSENTPFGYANSSALELFSTAGLDQIRTGFGVEIVDPRKSQVQDVNKNVNLLKQQLALGGDFKRSTANDQRNYSISTSVRRSFARFDRLKQTNLSLANAIESVAAREGMDPHILYNIMEFESGGHNHIDPKGHYNKSNPARGAQGILQFTPDTLRGLGADPETFAKDYPTIESQLPLVVKYLDSVKAKYGPLNTPYKAYMSVFNPASINDDMFAPFADSSNASTASRAALIAKQNAGSVSPADAMLHLGINYYRPDGGTITDQRVGSNGPVKVTATYVATQPKVPAIRSSSTASGAASELASKNTLLPGINIPKISSGASDATRSH